MLPPIIGCGTAAGAISCGVPVSSLEPGLGALGSPVGFVSCVHPAAPPGAVPNVLEDELLEVENEEPPKEEDCVEVAGALPKLDEAPTGAGGPRPGWLVKLMQRIFKLPINT